MWSKDNIVGILLLAFCAVAGAILIVAIITGDRPTVPDQARIPIAVVGGGLFVALTWQRISAWFKRR